MPKLLIQQYAKVLYSITKELSGSKLDEAVLEFFKLLQKNQALKKIDAIIGQFLKYSKEKEGIEKIKITSADKLSADLLEKIASKFSDYFEIEEEIDEKIIGGVKVKKGNVIFDASVKAQLEKMKLDLT